MADNFNFDEIMGNFFPDSKMAGSRPTKPNTEKGVAWSAKLINGQLYVPIEQVAELLANNNILPKMQERIKANVQAQADKNTFGI